MRAAGWAATEERMKMEILDRYLQSVKKHLPWQRQEDILAELRANMESQLEDKEAELGRPLSEAEAMEWLKQFGPPIRVAARYQRQQYLIGPAVFPAYWYALRLSLGWMTAIYAIGKTVSIVVNGQGWRAAVEATFALPFLLLVNAAIVTAIFVVIEQVNLRRPGKIAELAPTSPEWSPADLPPLDGNKPRSFGHALADVIFGILFFVWLLLVPHYPFLLFGPGAWYLGGLPVVLAPVWWPFYWCLVGVNLFELTWKIVDFTRGAWQGPKRTRHIAMHALSLIPLAWLLAAPGQVLFVVKNPAVNAAAHGADVASLNKGMHQLLLLAVVVIALQLVWALGKMGVQAYRARVANA